MATFGEDGAFEAPLVFEREVVVAEVQCSEIDSDPEAVLKR